MPLLAPGGARLGALLLGCAAGGINIEVVRTGLLLASRLACNHQGDLAGLAEAMASVLLPVALHGQSAPVGTTDSDGDRQLLRGRPAGGGSDSSSPADDGHGQRLPPRRRQTLPGMSWLLRFADDRLERRFLKWHARSMMKVGMGGGGGCRR